MVLRLYGQQDSAKQIRSHSDARPSWCRAGYNLLYIPQKFHLLKPFHMITEVCVWQRDLFPASAIDRFLTRSPLVIILLLLLLSLLFFLLAAFMQVPRLGVPPVVGVL